MPIHKWRPRGQSYYGIYVGPSVLACSRVSRTRGRYLVEDCAVAESWSQRPEMEWLSGLDVGIRGLLRKCRAENGVVRVVFDDSLIHFFLTEQNAKVSKKELAGLVDWHAGRSYPNAGDYAWSGDLFTSSEGSVLYAEGIAKRVLKELEIVYTENNLLWLDAGSAASLIWNCFEPAYKRKPGMFVNLGREGWTLIAWRDVGIPSLLKFGRWRMNRGWESDGDELVELRRLITAYRGGFEEKNELALYIDGNDLNLDDQHQHIKSLGHAIAVHPVSQSSCSTSDNLAPFATELALATTRAYSK